MCTLKSVRVHVCVHVLVEIGRMGKERGLKASDKHE